MLDAVNKFEIRAIRGEMSMTAFAALLGVTQSCVHYWEEGAFAPRGPARRLLILLRDDEDGRVRRVLEELAFGRPTRKE